MPTGAPVDSTPGTEAFGIASVHRSMTAASTRRPGALGQVAPSAQVPGTAAPYAAYGWKAGYRAGYLEAAYPHAVVVPDSSIKLETEPCQPHGGRRKGKSL